MYFYLLYLFINCISKSRYSSSSSRYMNSQRTE